jgi:hypothetical protein
MEKKESISTQQQNWTFCKYTFINIFFSQSELCSTYGNHNAKFHNETMDVCTIIMAGAHKIREEETCKHKCRERLVPALDRETNI